VLFGHVEKGFTGRHALVTGHGALDGQICSRGRRKHK